MARSEFQYLTWTEEDWEKYEESTVTIALPFFDKLRSAAELLSQGARPGKEAKEHYAQIAKTAQAIWHRETEQYSS